jgi:hypothetical protein
LKVPEILVYDLKITYISVLLAIDGKYLSFISNFWPIKAEKDE